MRQRDARQLPLGGLLSCPLLRERRQSSSLDKMYASLPVCAIEDMPHYFNEIERYFNENLHLPLEIYLADQEAVDYLNLPAERYSVTELPDAKDYLYSAEALKTLSGKALHKKKNNLNAFKKAYDGRYEYRTLCCSDGCEVWKFLDKWREGKGQEVEGHLDYEVEGIHEILRNCSMLSVRMGGIYVDDQLEAFSIWVFRGSDRQRCPMRRWDLRESIGLSSSIIRQEARSKL